MFTEAYNTRRGYVNFLGKLATSGSVRNEIGLTAFFVPA
jgi:hypothetical protein